MNRFVGHCSALLIGWLNLCSRVYFRKFGELRFCKETNQQLKTLKIQMDRIIVQQCTKVKTFLAGFRVQSAFNLKMYVQPIAIKQILALFFRNCLPFRKSIRINIQVWMELNISGFCICNDYIRIFNADFNKKYC